MSQHPEHNSLVRGWMVTIARYLGAGFLGFVWTVAVTRTLEPADAGILLLVGSLSALLGPIIDLGMPLATSYLIAGAHDDPRSVRGLVAWILRRLLLLGFVVALIASIVLVLNETTAAEQVGLGLSAVPFAVGITLIGAYYRGTRQFSRQAVLAVSPYVMLSGLTLVAVALGSTNPSVYVWVVVGAYAAPCLLAAVRFGFMQGSQPAERMGTFLRAWRYAWRLYLSEAAAAIRARVDILVVAVVLGTTAAATFGTAAVVGSNLAIASLAANLVLFPYVANSASQGGLTAESTALASRLSFTSTLVATAVVLSFGPQGFAFVFGPEFDASWAVFALYMPGVIALSAARVVTADLMARGEVTLVMRISLTTTAIGLLLLGGGIAVFGLMGAALATSVTGVLNAGWRVAVLHKLAPIRTSDLLRLRRSDLSLIRSAIGGMRRH